MTDGVRTFAGRLRLSDAAPQVLAAHLGTEDFAACETELDHSITAPVEAALRFGHHDLRARALRHIPDRPA